VDESELVAPEVVESMLERQRRFWLLLLRKGSNRGQDAATVERLQLAHLRHLFSLRERGLLTLFGPVDGDRTIRGIGVLLVPTREEAEALMARDPMVAAGRLRAEIRPWFTLPGASLPE
jgi:uncharacterized protein YciI